jgi:(1->4)-alpha-D-glucan 1-alpha-D-glucosylmutase
MSTYKELVRQNKRLILENHMGGDWDNLVNLFYSLNLQRDFSREKIKSALGTLMMALPVYRIYPDTLPLEAFDLQYIEEAFMTAASMESDAPEVLRYLKELFLSGLRDAEEGKSILVFMRRMMQFTGPLTAKGVEDTTFYVYNPMISHDEVGDSPSTLGISIQKFHEKMHLRQQHTPLSLNATSTHDTKRGEDARLRLNILGELADEWQTKVNEWLVITEQYRISVGSKVAPDTNESYFIFQSLLGGFPESFEVTETFVSRIQAYYIKVIREAKVNTSWEKPDEAYEKACTDYISKILADEAFMSSFGPFVKIVASFSGIYALGQALIKISAPGIPDFYQGNTLWDLSFVDPDNRRPVDYAIRQNYLEQIATLELENKDHLWKYLQKEAGNGVLKMFVTWKALHFRRINNEVFVKGSYRPLMIEGSERAAIAFIRNHGSKWVMIVVALNVVRFLDKWEHISVMLPEQAPHQWRNVFTGENIVADQKLPLDVAFDKLPVAMLVTD